MLRVARFLNALMIAILCGVLSGALWVQFGMGEIPCPLCYLQRLGMIGVAVGAALNLRFGIDPRHYGVCLLSVLFGGSIAMRQILLHIVPGTGGFGSPVMGMHLYTWSFLVFASCLLGVTLLLMFPFPAKDAGAEQRMNRFEKISVGWLGIVCVINLLSVLQQCHLGPCNE